MLYARSTFITSSYIMDNIRISRSLFRVLALRLRDSRKHVRALAGIELGYVAHDLGRRKLDVVHWKWHAAEIAIGTVGKSPLF
jgi:hypothetical protein